MRLYEQKETWKYMPLGRIITMVIEAIDSKSRVKCKNDKSYVPKNKLHWYVYTDMQNQTIAMSLLFIEAYTNLAECCSLARFSFVWYTFESTHFGSKKISITLKKKVQVRLTYLTNNKITMRRQPAFASQKLSK